MADDEIKKVKLVDTKGKQVYPEIDPKDGGVAIERVDSLPETPADKFYYIGAASEEIIAPEDVERQAIPTTGKIKKFYINRDLDTPQVIDILQNLTYNGENCYYVINDANSGNRILYIEKQENEDPNPDSYYIYLGGCKMTLADEWQYIDARSSVEIFRDQEGWNSIGPEVVLNDDIELDSDSENEKLKDLFFYYPETSNIEKAAIPNKGTVEQFYINTDLSIDEVKDILSTIDYIDLGSEDYLQYPVLLAGDPDNNGITIFIFKDKNEEDHYEIGSDNIVITSPDMPEGTYETGNFGWDSKYGWNTGGYWYDDNNNLIDGSKSKFFINAEVTTEHQGLTIGAQNDKLKDLIYIASAHQGNEELSVKTSETWKFVPVLGKGKVNQVLTYVEKEVPAAVPNSGKASETVLTAHTEVVLEKVVEILNTLDYPYESNKMLISKPWLIALDNDNGVVTILFAARPIGVNVNAILAGVWSLNNNEWIDNPNPVFVNDPSAPESGWDKEAANEAITFIKNPENNFILQTTVRAEIFNDMFETDIPRDTNIEVGSENEKIKEIFSSTTMTPGTAWKDLGNDDPSLEQKLTIEDITKFANELGHDIYPINNITINTDGDPIKVTFDEWAASLADSDLPESDIALSTCYLRKDKILYFIAPVGEHDFVDVEIFDLDDNSLGTVRGTLNNIYNNDGYWYSIAGIKLAEDMDYESNFINISLTGGNSGSEIL